MLRASKFVGILLLLVFCASPAYASFALQESTTDELNISTGGITRIIIDSVGRIGINTTNPDVFSLQIAGDIGPETNNTWNLGSTARQFLTANAQNIEVSDSLYVGTNITIGNESIIGTQQLYLNATTVYIQGELETSSYVNVTGYLNASTNICITGSNCLSDFTADTSAATICSGSSTYLDGGGNCDDFSSNAIGGVNTDITSITGLTGEIKTSSFLNQTQNGTIRYFANGCTEIANVTGVYIICP